MSALPPGCGQCSPQRPLRQPRAGAAPDAFRLTHEHGLTALMVAGFIVVSMTGAITALGDSLFPVRQREQPHLDTQVIDVNSATQHFLDTVRRIASCLRC